MNVLVTGGAGFFGSMLAGKLQRRGDRVRVFDVNRLDEPTGEIETIKADIRDLDAVKSAFDGVEVVHHNVAQVPLAKDRHLFDSVNRGGTRNVLEAARHTGVRKVIYTSSSAVFGVPRDNPVTEQTPPTPMEAYGRAKYDGELLCREYADEHGVDVTIIRPRTIMGHGRLGIFQILFEWIRSGDNVPVFGKGDNVYQFVHAEDLADACILAGERPGATIYNCGTDRYNTMREVLEDLCHHANTGSKVRSVPMTPAVLGMKLTSALGLSPLGPYHSLMYGRSLYFDISKAKEELSWQPTRSNTEMFIESYEWYLEHRDEVLAAKSGGSAHRSAVKHGVLGMVRKVL
ncbi:MAG: hypothetical protein CMJ18_16210 [Phycisphaeraceae bacterium]|nr:hypothetical protein [Phycisphaeraceae bacterium]